MDWGAIVAVGFVMACTGFLAGLSLGGSFRASARTETWQSAYWEGRDDAEQKAAEVREAARMGECPHCRQREQDLERLQEIQEIQERELRKADRQICQAEHDLAGAKAEARSLRCRLAQYAGRAKVTTADMQEALADAGAAT